MEGPRGLRREEISSLRRLTDLCFWKGLVDKYPQLFNEDNLENLRVIVKDGEVISHVGMTYQWVSIFGCKTLVACIGAVCTHPKYRMRGLATTLFHDACVKARRDGIDFMMVSGSRGLYLRAGCRPIKGCYLRVTVRSKRRSSPLEENLTLRECTSKDIPVMSALYRREPVRFLRRLEDYRRAFECRHVMDKQSAFLMIEKNCSPRAYIIFSKLNSNQRRVYIGEYAGERVSITNALKMILEYYKVKELILYVYKYDSIMKSELIREGFQLTPDGSVGSIRIINFVQFMERLMPYFEEIIGYKEAERLSFSEINGKCKIEYNGDHVVLGDYPETVQIIFGSSDAPTGWLTSNHRTVRLLKKVLPLPLPWYGINFV
ncbi:TPA: GNAT family N-acetyltransferase [Candidatus Bathyarchaeota archaeon]|nr:GNAT family N-acetyltransferase [Candidatus Bathyarchaeota archaeon]